MTERNAEGNNPAIVTTTGLEFEITDTKLYAPVITLSKENDIKLLAQLKSVFKKTIKWNKYRSQMTIQPVLWFTRDNAGDNRDSFSNYCLPNIEIKDFNDLIDRKSFFDLPVKNKEEAYEKIIDMSNNNDYKTGNLLDFRYFKENYKLIATDLSKQTKSKDPQQIDFIGKLENQNHGATMVFIIEKSEETTFNFSQNFVTIVKIMETQKVVNLLNGSDNENSKFATKKWYVLDSESKGN